MYMCGCACGVCDCACTDPSVHGVFGKWGVVCVCCVCVCAGEGARVGGVCVRMLTCLLLVARCCACFRACACGPGAVVLGCCWCGACLGGGFPQVLEGVCGGVFWPVLFFACSVFCLGCAGRWQSGFPLLGCVYVFDCARAHVVLVAGRFGVCARVC